MKCLINEEILALLIFFDLDHCIECIKEKYVKHIEKSRVTHSSGVIEIIHTDICGLFNVSFVDRFNSRTISPAMNIFILYVSRSKCFINLRYLRLG
jgi:hypothetical protein